MVDPAVLKTVKTYLDSLPPLGIHARRAILYGSQARGTAHEWSDIDLIVLAPEFDEQYEHLLVKKLWRATAAVEASIEPIPCGEREWETDDSRPILEIARREGVEITL